MTDCPEFEIGRKINVHINSRARARAHEHPVRRFRIVTRFARVVSVIFLATVGAAPGRAPIRPEPQSLERATPKLFQSLRADPYDYFRFVNQSWIARVCSVFRGDPQASPVARLHGDAHVEQFAVTNESWGLDPSLVEGHVADRSRLDQRVHRPQIDFHRFNPAAT